MFPNKYKKKNIDIKIMNKKQLQESIMAGVRKAFSTNKVLNEGFSTWSETNVRKFDMKGFSQNAANLCTYLFEYVKKNYITLVKFVKYTQGPGWEIVSFAPTDKVKSGEWTVNTFINNITQKVNEKCESKSDKIAEFMDTAAISIDVVADSYLMKYIDSTLDPNGKIKDSNAIVVNKSQKLATENVVRVYISVPEFMSEADKVFEYFS